MTLFLKLKPTPYSRPRFNSRTKAVFDAGPYRQFKREFQLLFKKACSAHIPLEGALAIEVGFFFARPKSNKHKHHITRPDGDNLIKAVMDAGNELIWKDDAQICDLLVAKSYCSDPTKEGISLKITKLD